ncbi:hypothetical protein LTR70_002233 [Exophiala xenobiotica]|uniref:ER-bound oxygenase mpaB/mpaB'/Rubber oxygenase catalytic domain-containing protein n=1 Tax=Lithohypha guttulata TaxID=1690604 RepID=A0ABR0KLD3_9EURO|nr:hypothetical protein LTR24_001345 [Lithohypha guttulata]KAK5325968.1 hypothetical protein LTR70_002233 [Exophiala xenobiotica]
MAWPNPFRRRTANTRTCWGYTFDLTPDHLTAEQAHPLKHSYDVLGEEALDALNELFPPESTIFHPKEATKHDVETTVPDRKSTEGQAGEPPVPHGKSKPKRDLYELLKDNHSKHPKLDELWSEVNTILPWVDWDQIARGQDVFYRYGGATLTGLAYQSLLGGMGANRVVEVLARTGGFGVNVARHRLFETTQHILQCTRSLQSIQPGGDGFASSIRVRLLHASVRQRILKLTKTRPTYYSVDQYGVPINDLDSIATIGTFSGTIIWLSLPRQGIYLRPQEVDDYIALWRLIAHYVGTPTAPFETPARAKCMMESLLMNEINPSQTSRILANNIIRCLENQPPAYASRSFLEANARWLNGSELCDALGLGRPSAYHTCLVAGQCIFFMALCYVNRSIPYLDRRKVANLKRIFWQVIVESKFGLAGEQTVFDFKYVPQFDTVTYKGGDEEIRHKSTGGIEQRNLGAFLLGTAFMGVAAYVGLRTSIFVAGTAWRVGGYGAGLVRNLM